MIEEKYSRYAILVLVLLAMIVPSFEELALADVHDYFTAHQDPEIERYLGLVDNYHTSKVMLRIREDNMNHALLEVQYTLDRFPNHPRGLILVESVGRLMGVPEMAVSYYEKALSLYPQYALTHAQFGKYLFDLGKIKMAIDHLNHAVEMDPKLVAAFVWLAEAQYKNANHDLAKKAGSQARALGYKGELPFESSVERSKK